MAYLRFREVANTAVYSALEEVNLGEDEFVVQSLELSEQGFNQSKRRLVLLRVQLTARCRSGTFLAARVSALTAQRDAFPDYA